MVLVFPKQMIFSLSELLLKIVEEELNVYRRNETEFYDKVGESNKLLAKIEIEECNIGNIIADSMNQQKD